MFVKFTNRDISGSLNIIEHFSTEVYIATAIEIQEQNCLLKSTVQILYLEFIFYHMLTFIPYIEVYFTFALVDCVRHNEDFVKSKFCSIPYILL